MRKSGMSDAAILAALRAENQAVCEPPLEVTKIAAGIKRYPAAEAAPPEDPPREPILAPWLVRQSLVMIYAWRGVGRTYFALEWRTRSLRAANF